MVFLVMTLYSLIGTGYKQAVMYEIIQCHNPALGKRQI